MWRPGVLGVALAVLGAGCGDDGAGAGGGACAFDPGVPAPFEVQATALALDPIGDALWIGTPEGVTRLSLTDGATERWGVAEGLASAVVVALAVDDQGRAWAGHGTASCQGTPQGRCGVSLLAPGAATWSRIDSASTNLIDDRVEAVGQAADGRIWVGTGAGAAHTATGQDWTPYFDWQDCANPGGACQSLFSFVVSGLAFEPDGAVWFAIEQQQLGVSPKPGGVARRDASGRTDTWDRDRGLPSNRARAVVVTDAGAALASGTFGVAVGGPEVDFAASHDASTLALATADGEVWGAQEDGALVRRVGEGWEVVPAAALGPVRVLAGEGGRLCAGGAQGVACYDTRACAWQGR